MLPPIRATMIPKSEPLVQSAGRSAPGTNGHEVGFLAPFLAPWPAGDESQEGLFFTMLFPPGVPL